MQQGKNVFNRDKDVGGWGSLTVNGELGSLKKIGKIKNLQKKYVVKRKNT